MTRSDGPVTRPQERLIRALRASLGVRDSGMPVSSREARTVIVALMARKASR
jgi:hypothetical protein